MVSQNTQNYLRAYSDKGKTVAVSPDSAKQLAIVNSRAGNRSGGTINVGILASVPSGRFKVYTQRGAGPTYTDVTDTAAQIANTTNNDGFVFGSKYAFGLVGLTVSNTATGGTYAFEYWNGTTWATLTTLENFTNFNAAADAYIVFLPPMDWVVGGPTGLDANMFHIRAVHTTAPGDTGTASVFWFGEFLDFYEGVADNGVAQLTLSDVKELKLDGGRGLFPYFSTANAANYFGAFYSVF